MVKDIKKNRALLPVKFMNSRTAVSLPILCHSRVVCSATQSVDRINGGRSAESALRKKLLVTLASFRSVAVERECGVL